MVRVTRLDGTEIIVNPDLIIMIEETPDLVLSFSSGQHVVVREKAGEFVERTIAFRRRIHGSLGVVPTKER